jgi:hypothetical protein
MWWPGVHHRLTQATFYIFPTKNYYKYEKQQFLSFHVHFLSLDFFSFPIKMSLMHYLILFQLMIMCQNCASQRFNLTDGFLSLPLNQSNFDIQRPYDVPEDQRYSFIDGVHKLWVHSTDKPHSLTSKTHPRTEIRIQVRNVKGFWSI